MDRSKFNFLFNKLWPLSLLFQTYNYSSTSKKVFKFICFLEQSLELNAEFQLRSFLSHIQR